MGAPMLGSPWIFRAVPQDPGDVDAVTGDGKQITLKGSALSEFADEMRGNVLLARHDGYDQARRILNPSFDKYPALVAQPTGTADVRTAVKFAREHSLLTAVKCGGHSFSGKSTCDKGIMIDLSNFRNVRIDPARRRAWVTGGSLLGPLDHESMAHGLVTPMGTVSHTGVGGLVTGGGFGRLARRWGLSIDNLVAVNVVTADGDFLYADATSNADLFWGVRGGGGNFGIVTAFEFRLHPMQREVLAGNFAFPVSRAHEILTFYSNLEIPDDLTLDFLMVYPPGGEDGVVLISVCYSGPVKDADRVLAPIRQMNPVVDGIEPTDYVALQRSGDTRDPRARATYLKSAFVPSFPEGLISTMVEGLVPHPDRTTIGYVQQSGGQIGRVANDATAFSHRDSAGNLLGIVDWAYGTDPSEHIAYIRSYWSDVEAFAQGFYTNDINEDTSAASVNANYRGNYERLIEVKNKYDPTNLFRLNANVEPTV
jgi:FAD/FMN-containing dehydrogenase